jgi:6-phosphogluconolactonase (cycloisomerase 2 family)
MPFASAESSGAMAHAEACLGIRSTVFCKCVALALLSFPMFATKLAAQSQTQQYIYANLPGSPATTSSVATLAKNGQTGGLSPVTGSPFPDHLEGGRLAVDALGRFLFLLNADTNAISMFQINSATGALTEVPGSPFSAKPTINPNQAPSLPISLATEKSGKYLYVGYTGGNVQNFCAITPFVIDAANLQLTLTGQLSFDVNFNPVQMFSDPRGLFLYVANGMNPFTQAQNGDTTVYAITATDGSLSANGSAGGGSNARTIASDPQGRFFFEGTGQFEGAIFWGPISPLDGTSTPNQDFLSLGAGNFPLAMVADSSGKFLYVQQNVGLVIYSIDQATGQPSPLNSPLASPIFRLGNVVADPAGPFLYAGSSTANAGNGINVFQVNPQDGSLTEIPGSPFPASGQPANIAISGVISQPISGPSAAFTKTSLNFGSVTDGQQVQLVTNLVNNGDQTLTINLNAATITGTNASDFSKTTTCTATLAANVNCSFSVTFQPSTATTESASLQISDNAPDSPQIIALSGVGLATSPSVAFTPGVLTFNPIAQGQLEGPQTIQITNIGSAPLHISSIAFGGANPQDFSQTGNCLSAAISVNASCNINVSFTPLAMGNRSASLTLTDDALTPTQTLLVQGTGTVAFQLNPAPSSATTASIAAGQTAQYNLQLNPGTGFAGNVSISCAGAPIAAMCNLSSGMLNVTSAIPIAFNVSVSTKGASTGVLTRGPQFEWPNGFFQSIGMLLIVFFWFAFQRRKGPRQRIAFAVASLGVFLAFSASGCGGGSGSAEVVQQPPATQVTPKGNYTITVSATANNLPAQSISLTLTVN